MSQTDCRFATAKLIIYPYLCKLSGEKIIFLYVFFDFYEILRDMVMVKVAKVIRFS